jgi:hypothetical protein
MTRAEQSLLPERPAEPVEPSALPEPAPNAARPDPRQRWMTRWLQPGLAISLLGLACWAYGVAHLRPTGIGIFGLLASGNAWFVLGLALLLAGFLLELRGGARAWLLALELAGLVVAIHSTVPIIFHAPEYAWVYKHIGAASTFQRFGAVTDPTNIYQEWPALFAAVAAVSSLAHASLVSLATWSPLAFELADALLLVALFRLLVGNRRVVWLAVLLYEGLVSWVGQDYLSPQAFGYLLWLAMAVIVLRWLRGAAPLPGHGGRLARLRAPFLVGLPPVPETTRAVRRGAIALVAMIFAAIVAAHQLSPYMALAGIGALALFGLVRPWWLLILLVAIAGGYLALHYDLIAQQFGGLFSGSNPLANAGGARGTPHASSAAVWSARTVDALMGAMWVITMAVIARRRKRLGQVVIPAALAFSPFVILLAQSYGGEAIYRVYLFSAPWCALLIAGALCELRARIRWPTAALVGAVALFGGLEGLYGPVLVNAFTPREVNASLWLYTHIPRGSLIVLPVGNFPALETADANDYDLDVLPADAQIGPASLNEGDIPQVRSYIAGLGHRTAYIVVSRSMDNWANFYGSPPGYRRLLSELPTALGGSVVYHNTDATIYRVNTTGGN